jgi:8-oxo-dGTP diphosphatase
MALEINIHDAQVSILRELLFHPSAGFAVMQKPTGLTSDHFSFHITRLVDLKLVEKVSRGTYRLTPRGKEYANRLDTDNNTVERQPKSAVLLALRRNRTDGTEEFLFQERLKNPYFGFWGLPSGKIRWGETIIQAAERECLEETGMTADFKVAGVYHEHVKSTESGELLEDKIFFVVLGTDPRGELQADFEGGHNEWLSHKEAGAKPKKFDSFTVELDILESDEWLIERLTSYTNEHF